MAVILAGGGNKCQSLAVDLFFRDKARASENRLFLASAISPHSWTLSRATEWLTGRDAFAELSFDSSEDPADLRDFADKENPVLFIMGGNTFILLDAIRKANAFDSLRSIARNGIIYGCSAGAILMGDDIGTASVGEADENVPNLKDLSAASIVPGAIVLPHYTPDQEGDARKAAAKAKRPCLCVTEDGGIWVEQDDFENIGSQAVTLLFQSGETVLVPPGQHWRMA